jgi:3-oxoacyl-(acyl-carrier-protein) synthase
VKPDRIVITGSGVICGSGRSPDAVLEALLAGRSSIRPVEQWDASGWPVQIAAEVGDYNAGQLTGDRKLLKFIRRTDVFGLYAADRAIESSGFAGWRATLDDEAATRCADATGVFVGSGGGAFANQYDYLPLIAASTGGLEAFGRELSATVNPMWLLRSLPNNVLGHVGIRHGLKGPNACITNHSISGPLAIAEAAESLRAGCLHRAADPALLRPAGPAHARRTASVRCPA